MVQVKSAFFLKRFFTFFPFARHQRERRCCTPFFTFSEHFFFTPFFLFHRITGRGACCTPFFTILTCFTFFPFSTGSQGETLLHSFLYVFLCFFPFPLVHVKSSRNHKVKGDNVDREFEQCLQSSAQRWSWCDVHISPKAHCVSCFLIRFAIADFVAVKSSDRGHDLAQD